ncbi:carbon-nitrogen hydrolase family protein [Streptomyces sp. NPDC047002]|uniref:carbon-nitrogen hydrolase family protein n=1 Tax=Streptomyces sp. NPDC047002 TaxID=3155475 RepID=UPI003451DF56
MQARAVPGDIAANSLSAARQTDRAASDGARVVVLPELHLPGYDLATLAADPRAQIPVDDPESVTDPRLDPLRASAQSTGATILVGAALRGPHGSLTNSLLAVRPTGTVSAVYDKQHLWHADEAALFRAGRHTSVLDVDGWRLGLAICYDMSFPEHARAAAVAGADAYVCASAFASGNEHRARVYMAARALENTVYSVFVNPVGGPADRPCSGASLLYGPDGTLLTEAQADKEQVLTARFSFDAIERVRGFLHMLEEHRTAGPAAVTP